MKIKYCFHHHNISVIKIDAKKNQTVVKIDAKNNFYYKYFSSNFANFMFYNVLLSHRLALFVFALGILLEVIIAGVSLFDIHPYNNIFCAILDIFNNVFYIFVTIVIGLSLNIDM